MFVMTITKAHSLAYTHTHTVVGLCIFQLILYLAQKDNPDEIFSWHTEAKLRSISLSILKTQLLKINLISKEKYKISSEKEK